MIDPLRCLRAARAALLKAQAANSAKGRLYWLNRARCEIGNARGYLTTP